MVGDYHVYCASSDCYVQVIDGGYCTECQYEMRNKASSLSEAAQTIETRIQILEEQVKKLNRELGLKS